MHNKPHGEIGILGGMGAAASADFYQHLVMIAQNKYHATQDDDFPSMLLYNLPLIGFDEKGFVDVDRVRTQLIEGVQRLERAGSSFIVIPCNTVHYLYEDMQAAVSVPIISIIDVVAAAVKQAELTCVGLLNSASTRAYCIYEDAFARLGIPTLSTTAQEQKVIDSVISEVIKGTNGSRETYQLSVIVDRLVRDGAQGISIGCTELPLAITQNDTKAPLFNSTVLLAEAALRTAYGAK